MKHVFWLRSLFLCSFLNFFLSVNAHSIILSQAEYKEVTSNVQDTYICLDESLSDIKNIICDISIFDHDKTSPVYELKKHIDQGFNFCFYEKMIDALEYAERVIGQEILRKETQQICDIAERFSYITEKVLSKQLNYENIKDSILIKEENSNDEYISRAPTRVFHENVEVEKHLIVKKETRLHERLKSYGKALFKKKSTFDGNAHFKKNVTIDQELTADSFSTSDAIISGNLTVNSIDITGSSGGITIDSLTATDAVITNLTVIGCMDDLCVNNLDTADIVVDDSARITSFSSAGVVHNDASGNLTTSLVVDGDIQTGTIANDKLATVVTSNDVPNTIVLRDGSGNFSTNMITLNGAVTNPTDAATKAYVDSAPLGIDPKTPARVVSLTNVTISGLQTIDGVSLSSNDRVLLVGQSTAQENGLWLVKVGAWVRPSDFANGTTAGDAYVLILEGVMSGGSSWLCNTPTAIIGTDPITFVLFTLPGQTTGANVGAGTGLIFRNKTGNILNFKSLVAGSNVAIVNNANDISLSVSATSANTANTIVQRDALGNFSAGTITASLNGNATTATTATTAISTANFSGSLSGDVTGTQGATVVSFVGGQTAANVASGTSLANASTSTNTAGAIVRRDGSGNFSANIITASLNGNASGFTGSLLGDVTGTQSATVVSFVGGETAANVAAAATLTSTATSNNTPNTLVLRNGAGNFSAGTITANLSGNASSATTATTATSFTGPLAGDVTGTQGATVVSFVGGQSAANVASGTTAANAATAVNTINTIVKRDGSGNFSAGTITATLSGTATNFSGVLSGDVTGTQGATVVSSVGGQSAANVASGTAAANAATNTNTFNTIVKRDPSGNFTATTITANLNGTATNFSGALVGDVTGVQSATTVSFVGGQSAANVAAATVLANASTNLDTFGAIVRRDGSGNFMTSNITLDGVTFNTGGGNLAYYSSSFGNINFNANTGSPALLTPNVVFVRIGNIVTVTIAAQSFTASSSPQFYTASAAVPSALRPNNGQVQTVFTPTLGSGVYDPTNMGTLIIDASGNIVISRDANQTLAWSNATNQGWDSLSTTYCV